MNRLLFLLLVLPTLSMAGAIQGDSSAMPIWDRMWYTGGLYPHRWYDGTGPMLALFIFIFLGITIGWYLLRRLVFK